MIYLLFYIDTDGYQHFLAPFSNAEAALETLKTQLKTGWYAPEDSEILEKHDLTGNLTGWETHVDSLMRYEKMVIQISILFDEPVDM